MQNGKIRSLNADKGFGFIQPAAGGPDLFFHCSSVDAEFTALKLEQPVEYEVDSDAPKPRAKQVVSGMAASHPKPKQANAGYEGKSPGAYRSNATGRGPGSSRPSSRRPRIEINHEFGYVTKLPRKKLIGFISSVKGGPEYYFEPEDVLGKKFTMLGVGDYVRFIARPNPDDPKQPFAKAVEVVPKPINKQENNLERHPNARRKKPTWR